MREWLRELGTIVEDARIGVVHGFVKKTQKAPADAIALAAKRMKEMKK